jgi:hypothetical protein
MRWLWALLLLLLEAGDAGDKGADDDGKQEDDEEIRDPKALIKSLREANARLAKKLDRKDQRIQELEGSEDAIRSARLESAFIRAVFEYRDSVDLEAAWDLATYKGFLDAVKVEDDGKVDSNDVEAAIEKLVARYPYLIQDGDSSSDDASPPPKTRQPKPIAGGRGAADRGALERRFPALRGRGRRGRSG